MVAQRPDRADAAAVKRAIFLTALLLSGLLQAADKVNPDEAGKLIEKKVQVLDVRTEGEWEDGRLPNAIRIDWFEDGFEERAKKQLKAGEPVLVYCHSGGRSAKAAEVLEKLGFEEVSDLDGGVTDWKKAGKKLVK